MTSRAKGRPPMKGGRVAPTHKGRERKSDGLLGGSPSPAELRIDYLLAPLDRARRECNARWGIERIFELVPYDMLDRFASASSRLSKAVDERDIDEVKERVSILLRGYAALDAAALEAGHIPGDLAFWEYELEDGFRFAIIPDVEDWPKMAAARPDLKFFTMREIANLLRDLEASPTFRAARAAFPGAEISGIVPRSTPPVPVSSKGDLDDEIPF